jgi:hypothetical protein
MTDNGNKPRPTRTLTVKNFSVIKEAKLEFGKITVLIGPQSSGKSLLCRLAFFFDQYLPELANSVARRRPPFTDISRAIQQRFADWFPATTWSGERSEIVYGYGQHSVSVSIGALENQPQLRFGPEFLNDFERWKTADQNADEANRTMEVLAGPFQPSGSIYIPSGRAFFSTPNKSIVAVSQKNLDWVTQRFSTEMDFDYRAMIASSSQRVELLHDFGKQTEKILRGRVVFWDGAARFQFSSDPRIIPFDLLSSGMLELLPILNPLSKLLSDTKFSKYFDQPDPMRGPIFIEEPESGIFPRTQYELVCLFAWIASAKTLNQPITITTHSPYLLSSFNNLIMAGQLAKEKPELRKEIANIVPEKFWIEDGSLKAYSIQDGALSSILSESGLIDGEYLDSVSDTIGNEFDSLLRLEYDRTEAS